MEVILLGLSAFVVGFVHSLSPGHWFPVLVVAKNNRWALYQTLFGGFVAASGHVLLSVVLGLGWGLGGLFFEQPFFSHENIERIELISHFALVLFGLFYAGFFYKRHASCHGHTHHGPTPDRQKSPLLFLFFVGLSPCVAVLPVFVNCWSFGFSSLIFILLSFAIGVFSAFFLAIFFGQKGIALFDHPLLEHFGNVITGLSVAFVGVFLILMHVLGWH
jgi:ABC-type nickel/cobalt efflux system permease component RcnA